MSYKSERLIAKEYVELCLGSVDVVADDNPAFHQRIQNNFALKSVN